MPRGDKGGKSKGSGIRCIAANCGNTNADGVSLHTFPKDPTLLKKWSDFVKLKRGAWPGPTEYSALCSIHFEPSCFPFRTRFEIEQMGVRPKRVTLTSVACPTIHASTPVETTTPSKSSSTQSLIPSTPAAQSHLTAENRLQMPSPSEDILYQSSPPKKIRRGYMKREAARIIESSFESEPGTEEPSREEPTDNDSLAAPIATQQANMVKQVEQPKQCSKVSIGFQCSIRPSQRSKSCQTNTVAKEGRIIKHKISVGYGYLHCISMKILRDQAVTQDGKARYRLTAPKYKKGKFIVRKINVDCTYDYVETLMRTVFGLGAVSHMNEDGVQLPVEIPPPLCSQYDRPDKDVAIQNMLSRFIKNQNLLDGNLCSSGCGQDMQS